MAKTEVIAVHGWGFDEHFWDPWKPLLTGSIRLKTIDRGYFGSKKDAHFRSDSECKVLFTHSFGLHVCPDNLFGESDLLVIFSGFQHFHPRAAQFQRRSRQVLRQMISGLRQKPQKVLNRFWEKTFYPDQPPGLSTENVNKKPLAEDLQRLDRSKLDANHLKKPDRICILHGSDDAIVPRVKGRELVDQLKDDSHYLEVKKAGHALPVTHTKQCWGFIRPILETVF